MFPHWFHLALPTYPCNILTVIRFSTSPGQSRHRSLSCGSVFIKG